MENVDESGPGGGSRARGFCKCPVCGFEVVHHEGEACFNLKCPECGTLLERDISV